MSRKPTLEEENLALAFYRLPPRSRFTMSALEKHGDLERKADLWIADSHIARWNTVLGLVRRRLTVVVTREEYPARQFLELTNNGKDMMSAVGAIIEHYTFIDALRKARGRPDRRVPPQTRNAA